MGARNMFKRVKWVQSCITFNNYVVLQLAEIFPQHIYETKMSQCYGVIKNKFVINLTILSCLGRIVVMP